MTAGADGTTIDGMSDERIQRIIESMRDKSYLPKPARREYIAKKNSNKKRPLGIQSGNDKLVQEVVKMILESIYEPVFRKHLMGSDQQKTVRQHYTRYRKPLRERTGLLRAIYTPASTVLITTQSSDC